MPGLSYLSWRPQLLPKQCWRRAASRTANEQATGATVASLHSLRHGLLLFLARRHQLPSVLGFAALYGGTFQRPLVDAGAAAGRSSTHPFAFQQLPCGFPPSPLSPLKAIHLFRPPFLSVPVVLRANSSPSCSRFLGFAACTHCRFARQTLLAPCTAQSPSSTSLPSPLPSTAQRKGKEGGSTLAILLPRLSLRSQKQILSVALQQETLPRARRSFGPRILFARAMKPRGVISLSSSPFPLFACCRRPQKI